ncbi:MAG TPA: DUF1353 domain-containing protein [Prosthecobacter sp.]
MSRVRLPQLSVLRNPGFLWGKGVYALEQEWHFEVAGYGKFIVPLGYEFDGASIPRILWSATGYTPYGLHIGAAVEHDYLCDIGSKTTAFLKWMTARQLPIPQAVPSAVAHEHFYQRCLADGVRPSQAWTMGQTVKIFGPRWKVAA